jgi:hypothetical protein
MTRAATPMSRTVTSRRMGYGLTPILAAAAFALAAAQGDVGIRLVSQAPSGPADAASFDAAVSADGQHVIFYSDATNLSEPPPEGGMGVYRRDMRSDRVGWIDAACARGAGCQFSPHAALSADGAVAVYTVLGVADNPLARRVRVQVLGEGQPVDLCAAEAPDIACFAPDVSADGRTIVFARQSLDPSQTDLSIVRVDRPTGPRPTTWVRSMRTASTTSTSPIGRAAGTPGSA